MIDILNIPVSTVSRDLRGKYITLFGGEKVGKTTFGVSMPRALLCAFESGFNYLNAKAVKIDSWATFKSIVDQLKSSKAKETYDTIVIDTAAEAYSLCEKYVCQQNGVKQIKDMPYGQGWTKLSSEFEDTLRKITMIPGLTVDGVEQPGYGLVFLCHAQTKTKTFNNEDIQYTSPALPDRAAQIINRMVDLIGYIDRDWTADPVTGEIVESRTLITRATPFVLAGSRLPYLKPRIPFSYDSLVKAMADAIEEQARNGAIVVDNVSKNNYAVEESFDSLRAEAEKIWTKKVQEDPNNANVIMAIVEEVFGEPIKLSTIEPSQREPFQVVVDRMRNL